MTLTTVPRTGSNGARSFAYFFSVCHFWSEYGTKKHITMGLAKSAIGRRQLFCVSFSNLGTTKIYFPDLLKPIIERQSSKMDIWTPNIILFNLSCTKATVTVLVYKKLHRLKAYCLNSKMVQLCLKNWLLNTAQVNHVIAYLTFLTNRMQNLVPKSRVWNFPDTHKITCFGLPYQKSGIWWIFG